MKVGQLHAVGRCFWSIGGVSSTSEPEFHDQQFTTSICPWLLLRRSAPINQTYGNIKDPLPLVVEE